MFTDQIKNGVLIAAIYWGAISFAHAQAQVIDLGSTVPTVTQVRDGLFPEDACEQLRQNGFKCMGFKPAVRFSIPDVHFKLGSAQLPEGLKRQLDVFAQALSNRPADAAQIKITGHADASGTPQINAILSGERAVAVKAYLTSKGVNASLMQTEGLGAQKPADAGNPYAPVNRRVELSRLP